MNVNDTNVDKQREHFSSGFKNLEVVLILDDY